VTPFVALAYSFLFGLLHGILPDEHTWPITFSYAIGGASGKQGMRAGLYFSAAFTVQRMLVSELAYLALAPFLLSPTINGVVYVVVGVVMSAAGTIVLRQNQYLHLHFLGHHHEEACDMETTSRVLARHHTKVAESVKSPPVQWTILHGFIAGFGLGGFSIFVNTVAAPAMSSAWSGFLPGLFYGLGTMLMLVLVGALFGASLRWSHALSEPEVKQIGVQTGGRTLFFGGLLFGLAGIATLLGLDHYVSVDMSYLLIGLFMITVAIPAFVYSLRKVLAARKQSVVSDRAMIQKEV
jgi:sulfite exporter TauE/SafE